ISICELLSSPPWPRKKGTALPQRQSFHSVIERTVDWKAFSWRGLCIIAIIQFFVFFAPFLRGLWAQTPTAQTQTSKGAIQPGQNETPAVLPKPSGDRAIPLPSIADRAEELGHLLREISNQLMPGSALHESEEKTAKQAAEIRRRALETRDLLMGTPTPLELEDEHRYWRARSLECEEQRRLLTLHAAKLETQIQNLDAQQPEWAATWVQIRESSGIESVVERTKQQLDKIQVTKVEAQEQLNVVLTLQNEVAQQDQQVSDIQSRTRKPRGGRYSAILEQDHHPLWASGSLAKADQDVGPALRRSFDRLLTTAGEFWRAHKLAMPTLVGCYLLILLCVFKLRR